MGKSLIYELHCMRKAPYVNRPLYGLKAFSITIATNINDLPTTSPHGK